MQDEYIPPSSDELLKRYIKAADTDDWHHARNICNIAGITPFERLFCQRLDFSPEDGAMWVRLYHFAMWLGNRKQERWVKLRRELVGDHDPS